MRVEEINPYDDGGDKSRQIEHMFDSIAPAYDFMNTAMSFGMHKSWRNKALKAALKCLDISEISENNSLKALDIATGTGDVAFKLAELLPCADIVGIDLSEGMLEIARKKLEALSEATKRRMAFGKGDSLMLPFIDQSFSLVTVAYGVRNFSNLLQGLREMKRVLKPGGVLCIIELSSPEGKISAPLYKFYSGTIIPFIGKMVSGDSNAYSYLPESIAACPQRAAMASLLRHAGFGDVEWKALSLGAVTYYIAK